MKTRLLHTKFWNDPYVNTLDKAVRYFYIYLLMNEFVNTLHLYELPIDIVTLQTGLSKDQIIKCKEKLVKDEKIQTYRDYVLLPNAYKYQEYSGIKNCNGKLRIIYELSTDVIEHFHNFIQAELVKIMNEFKEKELEDEKLIGLLKRVIERINPQIDLSIYPYLYRDNKSKTERQNTELIKKNEELSEHDLDRITKEII